MTDALVKYDAMCRAIADAYDVDEVKELRDKAKALEEYARQSKNVEAERECCEIRLRAERRWGELYRQSEKAKGGGDPTKPKEHRSPDGIWSALRDFERENWLAQDPEEIMATMVPTMRADVMRLAPFVSEWIRRIYDARTGSQQAAE